MTAKGVFIVRAEVPEADRAEFEDWYQNEHLGEAEKMFNGHRRLARLELLIPQFIWPSMNLQVWKPRLPFRNPQLCRPLSGSLMRPGGIGSVGPAR